MWRPRPRVRFRRSGWPITPAGHVANLLLTLLVSLFLTFIAVHSRAASTKTRVLLALAIGMQLVVLLELWAWFAATSAEREAFIAATRSQVFVRRRVVFRTESWGWVGGIVILVWLVASVALLFKYPEALVSLFFAAAVATVYGHDLLRRRNRPAGEGSETKE